MGKRKLSMRPNAPIIISTPLHSAAAATIKWINKSSIGHHTCISLKRRKTVFDQNGCWWFWGMSFVVSSCLLSGPRPTMEWIVNHRHRKGISPSKGRWSLLCHLLCTHTQHSQVLHTCGWVEAMPLHSSALGLFTLSSQPHSFLRTFRHLSLGHLLHSAYSE